MVLAERGSFAERRIVRNERVSFAREFPELVRVFGVNVLVERVKFGGLVREHQGEDKLEREEAKYLA